MYCETGEPAVPKLSVPEETGRASAGMNGTRADRCCGVREGCPARKVLYKKLAARSLKYSGVFTWLGDGFSAISARRVFNPLSRTAWINLHPLSCAAVSCATSKVRVAPATTMRASCTVWPSCSKAMKAPRFTIACAKTCRCDVLNVWNTQPAGSLGIFMERRRASPCSSISSFVVRCLVERPHCTWKTVPAAARMVLMSDWNSGNSRLNMMLPAHDATLLICTAATRFKCSATTVNEGEALACFSSASIRSAMETVAPQWSSFLWSSTPCNSGIKVMSTNTAPSSAYSFP
mmetsp:Transcript_35089/g.93564  ORF Transcript_35089/g.93564 Transcript_35089/m.93564 type:complete len:291 (-) Transcript_35089:750-1622(-)